MVVGSLCGVFSVGSRWIRAAITLILSRWSVAGSFRGAFSAAVTLILSRSPAFCADLVALLGHGILSQDFFRRFSVDTNRRPVTLSCMPFSVSFLPRCSDLVR